MGPSFNFTTDFNRVTKQDVTEGNLPPLRESSEKVLCYLHHFHGVSRGYEIVYRSRREDCSFFRAIAMTPAGRRKSRRFHSITLLSIDQAGPSTAVGTFDRRRRFWCASPGLTLRCAEPRRFMDLWQDGGTESKIDKCQCWFTLRETGLAL